ncbi:extracellular RHS repeat protein [Streptomyces davaonensis JCM 4913]|uniref:Extracellular RHS repeat protein n=1 Tax=Streptomyces davaonensis (strain DSM 101723 / JCM 4913 / KCC S-0913 / 768) TaxID=1214101 RepID=K4R8G5_STRDJ|nr:polymorphic toxin-type HINT domain-containing protein [Streptomyces davaonensis]CCK29320.1 extracellular RHS repeat protein [Streptomyces davaonensis JCM 4913]
MSVIAAALLVGLLPAQSLALPPDPAKEETGRESLTLEALKRDVPVPGMKVLSRHLETLRGQIPKDQVAPEAGTVTPPSNVSGSVTFGSTTTPASTRTTAQQVALSPVGSLPVSLGQAPDQPTPTGTWDVTIPDRASAAGQGIDGALMVVRAPATGAVPVSVKLDYAKFESLYGADWASRLTFVQFPECYLTTPDDEACQTYEELETENDPESKSLTATVDPAADGTVTPASAPSQPDAGTGVVQAAYRTSTSVTPAATGDTAVVGALDSGVGSGSFKATSLASNGKWAAGGSSGAFTWSYPLTVPAPPAGPAPKISFEYNSQTVDGRTAVSSPQSSWIGEGWSYDVGFIERRYRTCKDDRKTLTSGTPNNTAAKDKTSDLCWASANAVMSLNGQTTELVREPTSNTNPETATELYRPQRDDGTRVEHRVGAVNGDNNGEYWVVTGRDGTSYYFGQHQVGGGHADTDSVSTVPVFGNHPGEPCHASAFADSRCGAGKQQAWRWGLDKVVDVHGNTMIVNWKQETNYYAPRKKFKSPEQYDRHAYPTSIEYGMRPSGLTKPSATIEFNVKQRCLKSDTACDAANFAKTDDPGAYRPWWDTPGNLNCKSTSKLCPAFPSFWTQLRLDSVTTKAARAGQTGLDPVDTYTLRQSFPEDWYDTSPGLWLNSITRTGYAPGDTTGTIQSEYGVSFAAYTVGTGSPLRDRLMDRQLPNLVPRSKTDQRPGFTRPRIGTVSTEYGGDIQVEYTGGCAVEPAEDKGRSNGTCYPVRWSPDGDQRTPKKAWFNKYVVSSVTETDKVTAHGTPVTTMYEYDGTAWAKSDDEFTRPALRTYSDWKGYRQVSVRKGARSTSTTSMKNSQSFTVTRYFQGVGGEVKDTTGAHTLIADDAPQFAGMAAETLTYVDSDGKLLKRHLSFPYSKQTASRARENEDATVGEPLLAHRVGVKRTDEIQAVGSSWRGVRTTTAVDDTYGLPLQVETSVVKPSGTAETLSDRTCTTTSYVHNTTDWLIGLPKEERVTGTSCAVQDTADPATQLKSSVRNTYDNLSYGAAPTKGLVTSRAEINGTGTAHSHTIATSYDPLGRVRTITAPGSGTTETQYTPGDAGGPLTEVKSLNAKGHTTKTTFDPGRGLPLTVTDPNGRVTRNEYDALGRLVKGWSPSRSSAGQSPSVQISYQPAVATSRVNRPASVTLQTLKDDGTYARTVTLYDGLQREAQTQTEAHGPGRIIVDTTYNDHGLVREKTGGYLAKGEPATDLFQPRSRSLIPSLTKNYYDGLERQYRASVYHGDKYKYASFTTHSEIYTESDPPGSTTPKTRTYFDALGRVTSVKHYSRSSGDTGRTTAYEYDARGYHNKVTDPAGNIWSYIYDTRGRVSSATDPDTGKTETSYDEADRPNHTTDALQQETFTEYDLLGRVRYVRQGSATASPVKSYTYDDASGGLGKPTSSVRHTADGDYVNRVTGYDAEYHVTGSETVIPPNSMTTGLSGTYAYTYTYTPTGRPQSVTLPAKGGLASEKVVTRYNGDGLPESTSGQTWYTADATYSPYGEVLRTVSGAQPYRVWTTNFVNPHTGTLQRTITDRETAGPNRIADSYYSYDFSGTITSNARASSDAAGTTWDTQCFTYDVMGELTHAWTSSVTPDGQGAGCKTAGGTSWGYRTDYAPSSGPVADAPDEATDVTAPDSSLSSTLSAAAPDPTTVSTGETAYRQSFTYDWIGNRATMTDHDTADATKNVTFNYGHGKTVPANGTTPPYKTQPHTMTWISSTPSGKGSSYAYDATGNTTVRDLYNTTQNLVWNQENKLDSITDDGTKTTYVYDADGNRLLENSPSGSTLYLGETELTTNATGSITKASRTYTQAGAPVVTRTTTNGSTTGHKLNVLLADHLGTANTTVEMATGQLVTRRAFKPYGELRGTKPTSWPNKRSYLGVGIDDTGTGLTHIGAREYDQTSGRFLSADPLIDISDPLQMNGYSYAKNSPVSTSDPDGLRPITQCEMGCSNGDDSYQDHLTSNGDGTWSYHYENTHYVYDGEGKVHSTVKVGSDLPLGKKTVYKPYNFAAQKAFFNVAVSLVFPDPSDWMGCLSGESAKSCGIAATDLPWLKALKLVPDSVIKKGAKAVEDWLGKSKCTKCFLAGTDVLMADGKTKDIEDIEVGDEVLATDPKTSETGPRKVTRLIVTEDDKHFNELSIATEDGIEKLTATHEHPFWSPSERRWVDAADLKPGTTLLTDEGTTVIVTGNRAFSRHARTYNLTVDDLHTYYVLAGQTPVLVHNSNCPLNLEGIDDYLHEQVQRVVDSYDKTGKPPVGVMQGGADPNNVGVYRGHNIPGGGRDKPFGYWTEMDVWPTEPGGRRSGMGRIVIGARGEVWYTPHYKPGTWVSIREGCGCGRYAK